MRHTRTSVDVLRPAIEAARVVLRRRDKDDVPASLSRVAASSARSLPPPLAITLLEALDDDPDLREASAKEVGSGPEVTAARAFLTRPDGWEEIVEEATAAASTAAAEREAATLRAELSRMTERRDAERDRVRRLQQELSIARDDLATEVERRAESATRSAAEARDRADDAAARLDEVSAALAAVTAERDELRGRLERSRAELERRRRPETPVAPVPAGGWAGDARALARHADEVFAAARARIADPGGWAVPSGGVIEQGAPSHAVLPPGIRPDTAEAVDAVLGWAAHVYVDGYNLAGALGALGEPSSARTAVRDGVDRMRALSRSPISIVFDSAEGDGDRPGESYVADADAELRRLAALDPTSTVVISDDREVIEGVTAAGATALWSQAVVEWLRR